METDPPDHTPKPVVAGPGERPAIITYVKPEMELYVATEDYAPPKAEPGKVARTRCTCNLVCTCEHVAACGCNLVRVRNPVNLGLTCTCDTVPVCTCNTVAQCTCDRVATSTCSCDTVCTCDPVCTCETIPKCTCESHPRCSCNLHRRCTCDRVPRCSCEQFCACDRVCRCQRVGGGGGSVCTCVPVIH